MYINNILYIVSIATCFDAHAYRKHQHMDYTYKTAQTVCTVTKLTTSTYRSYNS